MRLSGNAKLIQFSQRSKTKREHGHCHTPEEEQYLLWSSKHNIWQWMNDLASGHTVLFLIQAFQYPVITGCAQPFPQHLHIRNGAVEIKIRLNTHPDFLHLINPHFHMSTPPFCLILVFFPVPFFLTDLATFFALVFEKSFSVRAAIMMFLYVLLRLFAFVTMTLYSRHIRQALDLY